MAKRTAVAIDIVDPDNPYRYLGIRGQVIEITEEGAEAHLDSLSRRYLGLERYPWYAQGEVRQIFKIQLQHVITWRIKD